MILLSDLNLAFVDIETTGLNEKEHEIIEIAALVYKPSEDKVIDEWETKVAPSHIETASDYALKITGYINNPKLYTNNLKSALIKLNSVVKQCMIIGQNIEFDLKFLRRNMEEQGIEPSFDRHRKLDLMALAWFSVKDSNIPGMSLADLCDHFSVSNVGAHGALIDCRRAFDIYRNLISYYARKS
jgi:DNA polymerase III alpha subunit (gram-positive type)